jgi:hypothetical protein
MKFFECTIPLGTDKPTQASTKFQIGILPTSNLGEYTLSYRCKGSLPDTVSVTHLDLVLSCMAKQLQTATPHPHPVFILDPDENQPAHIMFDMIPGALCKAGCAVLAPDRTILTWPDLHLPPSQQIGITVIGKKLEPSSIYDYLSNLS